MIEQEPSPADGHREPLGSEAGETFESHPIGEYLRRQRVLRGMSAEELALMTRIPLRSLERLESGQFDGETDGFVRGFVRTVAIALGLDADDAIARMLHEPEPGGWERPSTHRLLNQGLAVLFLMLTVVVVFFVLRAGWNVLLGDASTAGSREVVIWHDPVRALAEEAGVQLDPPGEIDPGARVGREVEIPVSSRSDSAVER